MATGGNMSARVKLFFRGGDLKDMDSMSKSDPYAVLHEGNNRMSGILGRTETIKDNLSPAWETGIEVTYHFEMKQEFTLIVYDDDGQGPGRDDCMATLKFQLGHVMGARGQKRTFDADKGMICITAEEVANTGNDTIQLTFGGTKLKNMDFMGKSDPYFKLMRRHDNGTVVCLHKSNTVDESLEPVWQKMPPLRIDQITKADFNHQGLVFECYDADTVTDEAMGSFPLSFQQLIDADAAARNGQRVTFELRDGKGKSYGQIYLAACQIVHKPTFVEYLKGGLQINLTVAVDFTGSNGDPRSPDSLHYMNPSKPNQYVRATMSVGDILMAYDTDKQVPAFGFGGRLPDGNISHNFHLNMQQNPYVSGVQGVLDAYGNALTQVGLAGPTMFSPIIKLVSAAAAQHAGVYTVLLILTDGEITDIDQTIDAIVAADALPLSIVIVGVGRGCDFEAMSALDGDGGQGLRSSNGKRSRRDLVQFVPFRNFEQAPPHALAAEVLREIPTQLLRWAELTDTRVGGQPAH